MIRLRRRLLIDKKMQFKYALMIGIVLIIMIAIVEYHTYLTIKSILPNLLSSSLSREIKQISLSLLINGIIYTVIVLFVSIYVSHKIAGPAYRLKKELREIIDSGNLNRQVTLRKGDELQDVADNVNELLQKLCKQKNTLVLFITLFFLTTGGYATEFVNVKVGARALGMGNAFTAISDDANLLQYNPAGLSFLTKKELMFSYMRWLADTDLEYMSYVQPQLYKSLSFGIGLQWFETGMAKTDINGVELGDVKIRESSTVLSFSSKIKENIGLGTNLKIVSSTLSKYTGTGLLIDAGILYTGVVDVGVTINSYQLVPFRYRSGQSESVESRVTVGVAKFMKRMCIAVDAVKKLTANDIYVHAGLEFILLPGFAIQGGYNYGYGTAGNIFAGTRIDLTRGDDRYVINIAYVAAEISPVTAASFNVKFK